MMGIVYLVCAQPLCLQRKWDCWIAAAIEDAGRALNYGQNDTKVLQCCHCWDVIVYSHVMWGCICIFHQNKKMWHESPDLLPHAWYWMCGWSGLEPRLSLGYNNIISTDKMGSSWFIYWTGCRPHTGTLSRL